MTPFYADESVFVYHADCLDLLPNLPDASVDAVVTDPPYSLGFMAREWDTHEEREDAAFAYWLTGFIDGEGCFRVQRHERGTYTCTFSIKVRRDERGTLERIQRFLGGSGTIRDGEGSGNAHPQSTYAVQDKAGCLRLVRLLDKYPLRAKKRLDYEAWAEAVIEWNQMRRGHRWSGRADWSRMAELKRRVEAAREYADPPWSGHGYQDWCRLWAAECLRVLKPGGHLLAFGGARTYHRLTCAIEDAGFEIRDTVSWIYGSGFPKSLDVSKAIDKAAGAEREVVGTRDRYRDGHERANLGATGGEFLGLANGVDAVTAPATENAKRWAGWGTALKPAHEPIIVARKPLVGTVAQNVLTHGTGALNVDGCRVPTEDDLSGGAYAVSPRDRWDGVENWRFKRGQAGDYEQPLGRWPTNVVLSHAPLLDESGKVVGDACADACADGCVDGCPVAELDRQSGTLTSGAWRGVVNKARGNVAKGAEGERVRDDRDADSGGASRYFPTFRYGASDHVFFPVESMAWQPHGDGSTRDASTSAGRSTESSADSLPIDGSGSRSTDPSLTDTRSTTGTITPSTTTSPTSCASLPSGTTTTISDSVSGTAGSMGSSSESASGAASGSRSPSSTSGGPARGRATASPASGSTDANGSLVDETSSTPYDGRGEPPGSTPDFPVFRYEAKADSAERPRVNGVAHPTVKPLELMRWLVRLVTPPGGLVLDPFAGSGTTGEACVVEGLRCIAVEKEAEYLPLIVARLTKPLQPALDVTP